MNDKIDRNAIVRKIAGQNEHALRMGLMFNQQTAEPSAKEPDTVDSETAGAVGIMSACGTPLTEDEQSAIHLLDSMNWSTHQVGSFLEVLAQEA